MEEITSNKQNKTPLIHKAITVFTIAIIAAGTIVIYNMHKNLSLLEEMVELRENMIDDAGEFGEIQALAGEIKAIYDKYGIAEDIDYEVCSDSALKGLINGTGDIYSYYFSPEEAIERNADMTEQQSGIGVNTVYEPGIGCYVVGVFSNSGAEDAGIQRGDYLLSANGINIIEDGYDAFISALSGEVGTKVEVIYLRNNTEVTAEVIRGNYTSSSVEFTDIEGVAYIKIESFTYKTSSEFIELMDRLNSSGYEDYIIDLRNNPGGPLDTVIDMVDYIVPSGLIFRSEGKDKAYNMEFYSGPEEFSGNIVILTNNGTASASELFTQSLIDFDKATVIGDKTYGKGTVVTEYKLSNGGSLVISTAKYYTHSGTCIEGVGITPDIEASLSEDAAKVYYKLSYEEDTQLQAGLRFFRENEQGK